MRDRTCDTPRAVSAWSPQYEKETTTFSSTWPKSQQARTGPGQPALLLSRRRGWAFLGTARADPQLHADPGRAEDEGPADVTNPEQDMRDILEHRKDRTDAVAMDLRRNTIPGREAAALPAPEGSEPIGC
jgi:hypothetical protein